MSPESPDRPSTGLSREEFDRIVIAARPRILLAVQVMGLNSLDAEAAYWEAVLELDAEIHKPVRSVIDSYEAWLMRAARNNALDLLRKRSRQREMPTQSLDTADVDRRSSGDGPSIAGVGGRTPTPEEGAMWSAAVECVRAKLAAYAAHGDDEHKMVETLLRHVHGAGPEEIRDRNGHASTNAASQFIHKCYRVLRPLLVPCMDGLPPDLLPLRLRGA